MAFSEDSGSKIVDNETKGDWAGDMFEETGRETCVNNPNKDPYILILWWICKRSDEIKIGQIKNKESCISSREDAINEGFAGY